MEFRRSVELVLVSEKAGVRQILMSKRGPAKHGAGTYALPGGHIEWLKDAGRPETLKEAAIRETEEELGVALAEVVQKAFDAGTVAIAACFDDVRPTDGLYYQHMAVMITIPDGIEPDATARDHAEHVDLRWRTPQEVHELAQNAKIYPPHVPQVLSFLDACPRYIEINDRIS